jgi:hypothetical protein
MSICVKGWCNYTNGLEIRNFKPQREITLLEEEVLVPNALYWSLGTKETWLSRTHRTAKQFFAGRHKGMKINPVLPLIICITIPI